MLRFAVRVTRLADEITAGDITRLRAVGFENRAIHDLCAVIAYFNFVNRIAIGLGVELEDRFR